MMTSEARHGPEPLTQRRFSPAAARVAANVATVGFLLVTCLQLLLALGILPITLAWGGTQAVLTPALRVASMVAAGLMVLAALAIRRRAGLLGTGHPSRRIAVLAWVITAYMAFNILENLA